MTVGNVARTLSSRVDTNTTVDVDRAAPAIYDELRNYVGWPPSDNSAVTALQTTPSLKTVDSLFYTGAHESSKAPKRVSFAKQRSQTQRKRTEPCVAPFDGPIIDVALVACGLSSTLFFFHKMPRVVQSVISRRHYISHFR